jgi:hypothetical protein
VILAHDLAALEPVARVAEIVTISGYLALALSVFLVRDRFRSDASWMIMGSSFLVLGVNRMLVAAGAGERWLSALAVWMLLLGVWLHLLANAREGIALKREDAGE